MRELVNIVVNVLGQLGKSESIKMTRNNDTDFVFEGSGKDDQGIPYDYEISIKFKPSSMTSSVEQMKLTTELAIKDMIRKEIEEEMKKKKEKEPEILNEDKKNDND